MTEAYTSIENSVRFYGEGNRKGAQIPFNFELISYTNKESKATDFLEHILSWLSRVPKGEQANWVVRFFFNYY